MTRYSTGSRKRQATHAKLKAEVEAKRQALRSIPIRPIPVQETRDAHQR